MQVKVEVKTNHLRAALLFAAKHDTRYYLNGLHFRELNGRLAIEATNGHRVIRITTGVILPDPFSAIVPVDAVKAMIKAKLADVVVTFEAKAATFECVTHRQTWNLIDAKYPDFTGVIPEKWDRPLISGLFNPRYISDAWEAALIFKGYGKKNWAFGVKMLSMGDKAVYREKLDGETIEIAVMAMRT